MKKPWIALLLVLAISAALPGCALKLPAPPSLREIAAQPPSPEPTTTLTAAASPEPAAVPEPTTTLTAAASPEPTPVPEPTPRPLLAPEAVDGVLDLSLFEPAEEQGRIVEASYEAEDHVYRSGETVHKRMLVYLPYGYSEDKEYDVLVLLHLKGLDENFWLGEMGYPVDFQNYPTVRVQDLLDNLIQRGLCRPMIVVSPCIYFNADAQAGYWGSQVYDQFAAEFRQELLPAVADQFATYARGGDEESLRAARQHFGVLGASHGAYQAELSVLSPNLDLVSWYAMVGGGSVTRDYLGPMWSLNGLEDYPVDLLYLMEGDSDDPATIAASYEGLAAWPERFTKEENLRFTMLQGAFHNERSWLGALYNAACFFFRDGKI